MIERAYTVQEIERLRQACETKFLYGRFGGRPGFSRPHNERDMAVCVEEMTRTYMLAGLIAADLYASEREPSGAPD